LPPSLSTEEIANRIQGIDELLSKAEEIQIAIEIKEADEVTLEDPQELQQQLTLVENEIDAQSNIVTATPFRQRLIKTQEHRPLLLKVLQEAQESVYISSASLSLSAVDEEFLQNLKSAIDRGIFVYIAWGLMAQGNNAEAERHRNVGRECNQRMHQIIGGEKRII